MNLAISHSLSRLAVAMLAAIGLAMAAAGSASACGFDCVSGPITVRAAADGANVTFATTVPVKATVTPDTSPNMGFRPVPHTEPGYGTQHRVSVGPLLPGRLYTFGLQLEDQAGRTFTRTPAAYPSQSFRSQHRRILVRFQNMTVTDDSDFWSAGDLNVHFRVHNTIKAFHWNNTSWSSGGSRNPNLDLAAVDTSEVAVVAVGAFDDDTGFGQFCSTGRAPSWTTGSNSCGQWSTAQTTVYLRGHAPGWHLLGAMNAPGLPRFYVNGSYHVSYYP